MMRPDPGPSFAAWEEEGRMYARRNDVSSWDLGFWLVRGQGWSLDPGFKASSRITGRSRSHLHALYDVAVAFPEGPAAPHLAWITHKMLLRIKDLDLRDRVLERAIAERWTSGELERYFAQHPPPSTYGKNKDRTGGTTNRHRRVQCPNCQHIFPMTGHKVKVPDGQ
jgi:hypothetical protein